MSINIGKYQFDGSYSSTGSLQDRAGVYAIICRNGNTNSLIDVGESATVKSRVDSHDRKNCWQRNCSSQLVVAVLYTPGQQQSGRMKIEKEIRDQYNPSCGLR